MAGKGSCVGGSLSCGLICGFAARDDSAAPRDNSPVASPAPVFTPNLTVTKVTKGKGKAAVKEKSSHYIVDAIASRKHVAREVFPVLAHVDCGTCSFESCIPAILGTNPDRCLDAFNVALSTTCDDDRWFASTKELQLVSLDFCIACRGVTTLWLRVDGDTPATLLAAAERPSDTKGQRSMTRLPRFRARCVSWKLSSSVGLRREIHALTYARSLVFGAEFDHSLKAVVWPHHLERLTLGFRYNRTIDRILWPTSLQELKFGHSFNQPINNVSWPRSLQLLTFGFDFNQAIEGVRWTDSIREMVFGCSFNQEVDGVVWPASLQKLTFGRCFNRPIDGVAWPTSLHRLTFGNSFNQSIDGVIWPQSLRGVIFGNDFNQPIAGVTWPNLLQQLIFKSSFDQAINSVAWPRSLDLLTFGFRFNQSMDNATWPTSLRQLTLGWRFKQSLRGIGTWFPNLQDLTLMLSRADYPYSLVDVEWPATLRKLVLGIDFKLDVSTLPKGVEVIFKIFYGKMGFVFAAEPLRV